ncbi:CCR4-NOT transcription complex subunit 7 [Tupaia chinensis]|uniref:poly(A)-specific ribonuclease n=1 Tax=Tupaia chinensis TaxID=246437 RepID=L9KVM2_TUPCH|nr:CCR4-NOT transcription complex subunit 7 [Tupaia chinensis]
MVLTWPSWCCQEPGKWAESRIAVASAPSHDTTVAADLAASEKNMSLCGRSPWEDMYAQDSIELLTTSGIQFKKHEEEGIETQYFAELLMTSGVVLCEGVKWLSFHSGYDFGYLIKILTNSNLPEEELDFFEILRLFFPVIYDVKYLMKSCKNLKMFFEDHIDDAKYCGHLYGLGSGSSYVQNGTGNAYEEEANKQS